MAISLSPGTATPTVFHVSCGVARASGDTYLVSQTKSTASGAPSGNSPPATSTQRL